MDGMEKIMTRIQEDADREIAQRNTQTDQQIQELLSDPKRLRQAMGGESAKGLLGSLLGPKGR